MGDGLAHVHRGGILALSQKVYGEMDDDKLKGLKSGDNFFEMLIIPHPCFLKHLGDAGVVDMGEDVHIAESGLEFNVPGVGFWRAWKAVHARFNTR